MAKQKNKNEKDDDRIEIKEGKSSIAEFTKRPLPTSEEIEQFDDYVEEEARDEEIEESLNEIYHDDKGKSVDVTKLVIKRGRGFVFYFLALIILLSLLSIVGYGAYLYYLNTGSDATAVDFLIEAEEGKEEVVAGEEFIYKVAFKNLTSIDLTQVNLELNYPEQFIFLDSSQEPESKNNIWTFSRVSPNQTNMLEIRGKMIGPADSSGVVLGTLTYIPANFSSEFKKETSFTTVISDIGLEIEIDYISSVLVGEVNGVVVRYRPRENNEITNFRLTIEPSENIEFKKSDKALPEQVQEVRPGVWLINGIEEDEQEIPAAFVFKDKIAEQEEIKLYFEQEGAAGSWYTFYEDSLQFQVMKNDLNLTLIINGSRDDQGVDLGQTLNYSIVYANRGENEMKDVIIMAVLESDFLDWTKLQNENQGREKGNTITWTKEEIPALENLGQDDEGTIDFSIPLLERGEIEKDKEYQVKSYAQFSIGDAQEELPENADTKSNTIVNKINSDLDLEEQVRYFSQDNIAVGTGPLPPRVGEATSFKVYWTLMNNLHELRDAQVSVTLPEYVSWEGKNRASVGTVNYDRETREVVWQIGRLPITVFRTDAEFSISIVPEEEDRNKIIVLTPGSTVMAIDAETEAEITKTTKAKTTKLEDDDIANSDGIVQ